MKQNPMLAGRPSSPRVDARRQRMLLRVLSVRRRGLRVEGKQQIPAGTCLSITAGGLRPLDVDVAWCGRIGRRASSAWFYQAGLRFRRPLDVGVQRILRASLKQVSATASLGSEAAGRSQDNEANAPSAEGASHSSVRAGP